MLKGTSAVHSEGMFSKKQCSFIPPTHTFSCQATFQSQTCFSHLLRWAFIVKQSFIQTRFSISSSGPSYVPQMMSRNAPLKVKCQDETLPAAQRHHLVSFWSFDCRLLLWRMGLLSCFCLFIWYWLKTQGGNLSYAHLVCERGVGSA